jgi:hypothetical protein
MIKRSILSILFLVSFSGSISASHILIPMDKSQKNHLKSYGIAFWVLKNGSEAQWLLNYRGGSFMFAYNKAIADECKIRGVSFENIADAQANSILAEIADPQVNMDAVKLEKCPKVAVYSPKTKQPWDDAVTMVLTYAEIPYEVVYDEDIINEGLLKYDWLHLHHEDFTGQYGRFYAQFKNAQWYREEVSANQSTATKLGFSKVSLLKLGVAKKIRDFTVGGGFLFAMCSATDSYDVALAAEGTDICETMYDGDPADPNMNKKLKYENCFAFENFSLKLNPMEYEFSDIDTYQSRMAKGTLTKENDYFTLFEYSAKWDPIPTMLCQSQDNLVKGFWGQTAGFDKSKIKKNVLVMGENKAIGEARYIHGEFGKGTWTFYSGHDPEDYQHKVEDPPTDLNLHPASAGYRLILNNILFPAAKKKKQKT